MPSTNNAPQANAAAEASKPTPIEASINTISVQLDKMQKWEQYLTEALDAANKQLNHMQRLALDAALETNDTAVREDARKKLVRKGLTLTTHGPLVSRQA